MKDKLREFLKTGTRKTVMRGESGRYPNGEGWGHSWNEEVVEFNAKKLDTALIDAEGYGGAVDSDGMCNEKRPERRCVCREEFGYRVCGKDQTAELGAAHRAANLPARPTKLEDAVREVIAYINMEAEACLATGDPDDRQWGSRMKSAWADKLTAALMHEWTEGVDYD